MSATMLLKQVDNWTNLVNWRVLSATWYSINMHGRYFE